MKTDEFLSAKIIILSKTKIDINKKTDFELGYFCANMVVDTEIAFKKDIIELIKEEMTLRNIPLSN